LYGETVKVDLNRYQEFVQGVTSRESNSTDSFIARVESLAATTQINPSLLLTAGMGLSSEGGEFNELVKKVFFQGKPLDQDVRYHMKRELGDIAWYWINACRALGYDPNDVIQENVGKLQARYPGGEFSVAHSEHRQAGDL
jgi:NTP pyrophosphatase (non-canonical NTP hydrolase)